MSKVELVIRGGRVIDPLNDVDCLLDVAVHNGLIHSVGKGLTVSGHEEFNANGCLVTPGLVDCHLHCYEYATPLGVNPDKYCLARGVTTVVDGGSAGASTFPGLRKFIAEQNKTRVLCFLHIAAHGLAASGCASGAPGGEIDSPNILRVQECVDTIEKNRDMIVGVKVRLTSDIANNGKTEAEAYRKAIDAARKCKVPVMIHHTISTVPTQCRDGDEVGCPRNMDKGDLYTHTYHGYKSSIVDPETRTIYPDVLDAKQRGVLFDVGHGQGSFSWTVAEICAQRGFWPDTISTDLHSGNKEGPVYDLPSVMSKFYHLGMPLNDVIRSVTCTPARAVGFGDTIGSLTVGRTADVTVLSIVDTEVDVEDSQSQVRKVKQWIQPKAVWKDGKHYQITQPESFPNKNAMVINAKEWNNILVKDKNPPECL